LSSAVIDRRYSCLQFSALLHSDLFRISDFFDDEDEDDFTVLTALTILTLNPLTL